MNHVCGEVELKFNSHYPRFSLMSFGANTNYSISIDEAMLYVCHKTVSPSVRDLHELRLLKLNAKYTHLKLSFSLNRRAMRTSLNQTCTLVFSLDRLWLVWYVWKVSMAQTITILWILPVTD